ncbi:hypothetical protein, partial [Thiohalorhabdus methylotrophus]
MELYNSTPAGADVVESAIDLQLLIRDSPLSPGHARLTDKVWAHFKASRDRWRSRKDSSPSGQFPALPLYKAAAAYFGGIGQTGRLFQVLGEAARDARRAGSMGQWRVFQLRLAEEAGRVGNDPRARAALDRIHDRYYIPTAPQADMDANDRAWTAYLLALRYAYGAGRTRDGPTVRRDARFVLETVQEDRQFRLPYRCCWVPALKMLPPLQLSVARIGDEKLYSRISAQIAEARESALNVKDGIDFIPVGPDSIFGGDSGRSRIYGMGVLGGIESLLGENYEGTHTNQRFKFLAPHWPLFRAALAQWEAALHLGRADDRRTSYERAKKRLARLNVHYQEAGERRAAADGLIRARHRFRLAKAREAELAGEY